jgi:anti-anti-sigma regulatory factor
MLIIQRSVNGHIIFKIIGRIETEDVQELRELLALETAGQQLVLNLRDVTLVNDEAVKFLVSCEADNIKLENCPLYIREWIEQAKGRNGRRQGQ